MVALSTVVAYAVIILLTRIFGLRSFAKMSATDFATTVAIGSLLGATISSPQPSLVTGLCSLACVYLVHGALSYLRQATNWCAKATDNEPLLLMRGSEIIEQNLRVANVTREDLFAKLREANACNYEQIRAVVLETTGDVSVLHATDESVELHEDFLRGVRSSV
ncbi:MAG: DUF421 domain-containing protein [Lacipirellulaceae bacterium]